MASIQTIVSDTWTLASATAVTSASGNTIFSAAGNDEDLVIIYQNGAEETDVSILAGDYQNAGDALLTSAVAANTSVVLNLIDGTKYRGNDGDYQVTVDVTGAGTGNLFVFQKDIGVS